MLEVGRAEIIDCLFAGCRGFSVRPARRPCAGSALPQGPGRDAVEAVCTGCHQTNMITQSSGYTHDGWKELIGTMIDLSRSPETQAAITQYLAANFRPTRSGRQARARQRRDHVQGMGDAHARPADARSDPGGRRVHLVGRAIRQSDRAIQSRDRRDENIRSRPTRCRIRWSSMPRASPGTRATRTGRSARSIPRPARSPSTRCPTRPHRIRTPWCSISRASRGSRCRTQTWSAAWTRRAVTSSWRRCRRRIRSRTASRSMPTAFRGFHATGAPASTRSTRRPWRSRKSSCRSPARRSGVSISPTTA